MGGRGAGGGGKGGGGGGATSPEAQKLLRDIEGNELLLKGAKEALAKLGSFPSNRRARIHADIKLFTAELKRLKFLKARLLK